MYSARRSDFAVEQTQRDAWLEEIRILHSALSLCQGSIYFEYSIPRMGRRIDVVLLIGPAVFVLEFKVGERDFALHALDQVVDYALDLKNFHEPSHKCLVAPILIATGATNCQPVVEAIPHKDGLFLPIKTNGQLAAIVLGNDPKSGEDGLLQVREIRDLSLAADLVTLSACDSGVGPLQGEEGIASLVRAFLFAAVQLPPLSISNRQSKIGNCRIRPCHSTGPVSSWSATGLGAFRFPPTGRDWAFSNDGSQVGDGNEGKQGPGTTITSE